jgi:hypothetical protein
MTPSKTPWFNSRRWESNWKNLVLKDLSKVQPEATQMSRLFHETPNESHRRKLRLWGSIQSTERWTHRPQSTF